MTATMEEIRVGMADALTVIPGLQTSAYSLSNPTLPSAHVLRGEITYDQAFQGGVHTLAMRVRAYVADLSDIGAAKNLDLYLAPDGDHSVKAALEADSTLGGVVDDLHVTNATGEQVYVRDSGGPMLGSEWIVDLWL